MDYARPMSPGRYLVNEPSVISESIDGETIVLNFDNGHYYSLNSAGSAVWGHLARGGTPERISDALAARYQLDTATVHPAVATFVSRLEEEQLIRPSADPPVIGVDAGVGESPADTFCAPDFEKFTDMEKLLLLDPIHEVSDVGWPHRPR